MAERPSIAGLVAAAIAGVMVVLYIGLISSEDGENDWGIVAFYALLTGGSAVAAAAGSLLAYGPVRTGLLTVAAATLLVVGIVAIFSIGLPLILAGWLATGAAVRSGAGQAGRTLR